MMTRKYRIISAEYGDAIVPAGSADSALKIWTEERNLPIYTNPDSVDIAENSRNED